MRLPCEICLFIFPLWGCSSSVVVEDSEQLKQAVSGIERSGGEVRFDPIDKSKVSGVVFNHVAVTEKDLMNLRRFSDLRHLELLGVQLTDAGLTHLSGLRKISSLCLQKNKITGAGMTHLKDLTELRELSLSNTEVGDAGIDHLGGLRNLFYLNLAETDVTGK